MRDLRRKSFWRGELRKLKSGCQPRSIITMLTILRKAKKGNSDQTHKFQTGHPNIVAASKGMMSQNLSRVNKNSIVWTPIINKWTLQIDRSPLCQTNTIRILIGILINEMLIKIRVHLRKSNSWLEAAVLLVASKDIICHRIRKEIRREIREKQPISSSVMMSIQTISILLQSKITSRLSWYILHHSNNKWLLDKTQLPSKINAT